MFGVTDLLSNRVDLNLGLTLTGKFWMASLIAKVAKYIRSSFATLMALHMFI